MDAQSVSMILTDNQKNRNIFLSLKNNYKVFFFNSVVQTSCLLQSFQGHVKYLTSDPDVVSNVKEFFGDIEQTRELPRRSIITHECVSL